MGDRPGSWTVIIDAEGAGERFDHFLRRHLPMLSRAARHELIERGGVRVNGRVAPKGSPLRAGDRVECVVPVDTSGRPAASANFSLRVLYEDRWLVAVDKPAGVPSHALRAAESNTIASALLARYPEMADVGHRALEPGLLHRLDTDTSGILLAARDSESFDRLREAHVRGEIDKRYLALCAGAPSSQLASGFLRADRRRVRVEPQAFEGAKPVQTAIALLETLGRFALIEVRVGFAARHQVRAHLAALGHPLVGDALYGGENLPGLSRHFLHAGRVELSHPWQAQRLQLTAELPAELSALLTRLR
jgi:23S rRNA pseudouridine1911/1915/1917 synthase